MKSASILAIAQVLCLVSAAPSASNKAVRGLNSDEANGVVNWIHTILAEAYEKNPEVGKRATADIALSAIKYLDGKAVKELQDIEIDHVAD